jgi:hypothetical protein
MIRIHISNVRFAEFLTYKQKQNYEVCTHGHVSIKAVDLLIYVYIYIYIYMCVCVCV